MARLAQLILFLTLILGTPATAGRAEVLELARQGWGYELRTTMIGRDMSIPVRIHGRTLAGASICLVGERPHPLTAQVINQFRSLLATVHRKPVPMRFAGPTARLCGSGRTVVIRLFSGRPPNSALTDDLFWLNEAYQLGLPRNRVYSAASPAMAQTFFGRLGAGTHVMVKQPAPGTPSALEAAFYRSILIEELFQTFTFGMDILQFDRKAAFRSKLQEVPYDLRRLPWESESYMQRLLSSNPKGLCPFDAFMLHAVALAPVEQTTSPDFLTYIERHFDDLMVRSAATVADSRFGLLFDADCLTLAD
ncbi:hypothetical protein ACOXXX_12220 [Thalassococcus sp. BH17M4-6]|uniref:hypothetical protein n=1 Tax=Thalassococcus sp. BH17M4-6 TaxID=3413148 RepID=UPI003BCC09CA